MAVSYKKLFKLLIDRDMKKKDFKEITGISQGTLNKLQNGGNVMVDVLEKICLNIDCNVKTLWRSILIRLTVPKNVQLDQYNKNGVLAYLIFAFINNSFLSNYYLEKSPY